ATEFNADGTPKLSIASLADLESRLTPLIKKTQGEATPAAVSPLLRSLAGQLDVEQRWEGLTIPQQREVIRAVVTVRLFKGGRGARSIKPGRITLSFIGQPGFVRYT
ncbi:hypothetical protein ACFQ6V_23475, partial [Streptomyces roseifaciens]